MRITNTKAEVKETPHPRRVLNRAQLASDLGIQLSNPTLCRLERQNRFPRRYYISSKVPVWNESELLQWLDERQATARESTSTERATAARRRARRPAP